MGLQEGEEGRRVLGWGGTASDSRLAKLSEPHPPAGFKQWEGGVEPLGVQKPAQRRRFVEKLEKSNFLLVL